MLDGKAYRAHFPDDPAYELPPGVPRQLNSAALIEAADAALYRAKARGRNCVEGPVHLIADKLLLQDAHTR